MMNILFDTFENEFKNVKVINKDLENINDINNDVIIHAGITI